MPEVYIRMKEISSRLQYWEPSGWLSAPRLFLDKRQVLTRLEFRNPMAINPQANHTDRAAAICRRG
jgi:hypothetical protein